MIQIQLQPEIEAQLAAEAHDRGLELDQYIEKIVNGRSVEHTNGILLPRRLTAFGNCAREILLAASGSKT